MLLATTKGAYAFEPKERSDKLMTFTQRVLKTMRDKSSDKNSDGFVSVVELSQALRESQNSVEYQYPVIRNVGGDVRLRRCCLSCNADINNLSSTEKKEKEESSYNLNNSGY